MGLLRLGVRVTYLGADLPAVTEDQRHIGVAIPREGVRRLTQGRGQYIDDVERYKVELIDDLDETTEKIDYFNAYFDRDGRRDIWRSTPDALASIARYLSDNFQ